MPGEKGFRSTFLIARNAPDDRGVQYMNWDQVEGNWTQMKGRVKEAWGDLTDSDLTKIEGKRDRLAGALQERYGKQKEEAEKEIDAWLGKH